jgi:nitrogen fixation NifU-like protein
MKDELYHDRILELARDETTARRLDAPHATATINNPLCGDRVTIDIMMVAGTVSEVGHKVRGCALCRASAAVIGATAIGAAPDDLRVVAAGATALIKDGGDPPNGDWQSLDAFRPVHDHKSRHDCVLLPFQALVEALDDIAPDSN